MLLVSVIVLPQDATSDRGVLPARFHHWSSLLPISSHLWGGGHRKAEPCSPKIQLESISI